MARSLRTRNCGIYEFDKSLIFYHKGGHDLIGRSFPSSFQAFYTIEGEEHDPAVDDGKEIIVEYFLIDGPGEEFKIAYLSAVDGPDAFREEFHVRSAGFQLLELEGFEIRDLVFCGGLAGQIGDEVYFSVLIGQRQHGHCAAWVFGLPELVGHWGPFPGDQELDLVVGQADRVECVLGRGDQGGEQEEQEERLHNGYLFDTQCTKLKGERPASENDFEI